MAAGRAPVVGAGRGLAGPDVRSPERLRPRDLLSPERAGHPRRDLHPRGRQPIAADLRLPRPHQGGHRGAAGVLRARAVSPTAGGGVGRTCRGGRDRSHPGPFHGRPAVRDGRHRPARRRPRSQRRGARPRRTRARGDEAESGQGRTGGIRCRSPAHPGPVARPGTAHRCRHLQGLFHRRHRRAGPAGRGGDLRAGPLRQERALRHPSAAGQRLDPCQRRVQRGVDHPGAAGGDRVQRQERDPGRAAPSRGGAGSRLLRPAPQDQRLLPRRAEPGVLQRPVHRSGRQTAG